MASDSRAHDERLRLLDILLEASVPQSRINALMPVVENCAWMRVKLDDTREAIKSSNVAIKYDNGGGQTGIRENPLYKGYSSLWKSYMIGMQRILDALPNAAPTVIDEEEKPQNILRMIQNKHNA